MDSTEKPQVLNKNYGRQKSQNERLMLVKTELNWKDLLVSVANVQYVGVTKRESQLEMPTTTLHLIYLMCWDHESPKYSSRDLLSLDPGLPLVTVLKLRWEQSLL